MIIQNKACAFDTFYDFNQVWRCAIIEQSPTCSIINCIHSLASIFQVNKNLEANNKYQEELHFIIQETGPSICCSLTHKVPSCTESGNLPIVEHHIGKVRMLNQESNVKKLLCC